jgi:hypothetical protein
MQSTPVRCSKITATESAAKKLECNSSFSNFPVHLHETYKTYMIISQHGVYLYLGVGLHWLSSCKLVRTMVRNLKKVKEEK